MKILYENSQQDNEILKKEISSLENLLAQSKENVIESEHRNSDYFN